MAKLLMGNEAFAHAALEAGVRVVAGYPGTPSSELVETVAKLKRSGAAHGVHVEWSTNEKAALELAAGASLAGARALFTCKQVGLNVASDPLLSLNYVGVKGGLVLFVADDPGPISSQTEQDTRRFAAFAKVPVLDPATPEQGFHMMKEAFELSERYATPVILRATTRVCHASAFFEVEDRTQSRALHDGGFVRDSRWVIFPKRSFEAHGEILERLDAISCDPSIARFNAVREGGTATERRIRTAGSHSEGAGEDGNGARVGIVAGGVAAAYALDVLEALEERANTTGSTHAGGAFELPAYRFIQVGTPYPFPAQAMGAFAEGLERILVFEELDSTLEESLLAFAGRTHADFDVLGKLTGDVPARGELSADIAAEAIGRVLGISAAASSRDAAGGAGAHASGAWERNAADAGRHTGQLADEVAAEEAMLERAVQLLAEPPARPPVLCAGCPHRASFYAVKRALGRTPGIFCGDIGCYTLGNARPLDAVDTCLCMGAGITMAQGFSAALEAAEDADASAPAPDDAAAGDGAPDAAAPGDAAPSPRPKHIAFVGDSTFFASGLTGLANAAYNGHDITVCVLDNATTAMTGGQPHPGTGIALSGARRPALSIPRILDALGFACIEEANPFDVAEAHAAAERALSFEGPSAVIFRAPCIQLGRPEPPFAVNGEECTGCKRCISKIGCPAIGFDRNARGPLSAKRGQAFVDSTLCFGCGLCEHLCPTGALRRAGEHEAPEASAAEAAPTAPVAPAAPAAPAAPTAPAANPNPLETALSPAETDDAKENPHA